MLPPVPITAPPAFEVRNMTAESERLNWLAPGRCNGALRYSLTRGHALTSYVSAALILIKRGCGQ